MIPTADLCDAHPDAVHVVDPLFRHFGKKRAFSGPIATVKVHEDNVLVRSALEEPGRGRVLVVDGGGSLRCALVGDRLAALVRDNNWAGVVVFGAIRDSGAIDTMNVAVRALAAHPKKSIKRGEGVRDVVVRFAGVAFSPGHHLYADDDGMVVAAQALTA
ncbi:MAG: ribonuclease E activity regulator RraA [Myxococcota bacterium]